MIVRLFVCFRSSFLCLVTLVGVLLLSGCQTGETAFRDGDYAEAARVSADRLARKPDNAKAAEIFLNAYPQARAEWLSRARQAVANTSDPFRWEEALAAYEVLRDLSARAALTPFAGRRDIDVVYYHDEIQSTRINAVNARIEYADELMATGDRYEGREAFKHYEVAMLYAGERDDLLRKLEAARSLGTLLVGIDFVETQGHSINPSSMMAALVRELESHSVHRFVSFVPSSELGEAKAGQYVQLSIGEVSLVRSEAEIGKSDFRLVLAPDAKTPAAAPVEVFAKLIRREKKIQVACPARVRLFGAEGGDAVFNRQLPGSAVWATQWDMLQGDRRAVGKQEIQLVEAADPEHAQLMQQLAEAIAGQARDALAAYYKGS